MTRFLLDTNVVSESLKSRRHEAVADWLATHSITDCYLSVMTIGELQHGISRLPAAGARRAELTRALHHLILVTFGDRVISFDVDAALAWGDIVATGIARGQKPPTVDSQIAATAKTHGLTLVTRNVRDFAQMGIDIVNPWGD